MKNKSEAFQDSWKDWCSSILNQIICGGLLSSIDLRLVGKMPFHSVSPYRETIDGCLIEPESILQTFRSKKNPLNLYDRVGESLYSNAWSVFPVVAERENEGAMEIEMLSDETLQQRFGCSALVIIDQFQKDLVITDERRYGLRSPILTEKFKKVLIPESLQDTLAERLKQTSVPLTPVPSKKALVFRFSRRTIHVPDYETEIRRLMSQRSDPLFIHGVRLPTPGDLSSINED